MSARNDELLARYFLANQDQIADLILQRNWRDLLTVAQYAAADAPASLTHTDSALYRTLRGQITEFRIKWNLNLKKLEELAETISKPTEFKPA